MPYLIISYVSSAYNQVKVHNANIKALKEKHNYKNEIKWSSVSKSKYHFFAELIDYFFSNDLQFRAIVVDKSKIKTSELGQTYDDFYYKMYFQLISHKINFEQNYNIYIDIKDTLSNRKVKTLQGFINNFNIDNKPVRKIQNIHSHESLLLQMTDLLMGAISYHLRGNSTVIAKTKLIEKIKQHTRLTLNGSTLKAYSKFNLFFIDLK